MKGLPNEVLAVAAEGRVLEEPRDELMIFHLKINVYFLPHYCIENMQGELKIFDQKSI